jgi:hypothetical protein
VNCLRGVETEPVEAELVDPVRRVAAEVLADLRRAAAVEVQGIAPLVGIVTGEVLVRVL